MKNDLEIEPSMGAGGRGLAGGTLATATLLAEPSTVVLSSEILPAGDSPLMSFFHASWHS